MRSESELMMQARCHFDCSCWAWTGLVVVALVAGSPSQAAVIGVSATASTVVQELIDSDPASVTSESDEADLLAGTFPASARGELVSVDLSGVLVSQGFGLARLDDPTLLPQGNPEEFRLEAACYSNADNVAYIVETTATEERDVLFTADADPDVVFNDDGTQTIESSLFLSGAVFVWSTEPSADLTGLEGELAVSIIDGNGNTLLAGSISLVTSGIAEPSFTTTGPISVTVMSLDDLAAFGELDDDTLTALEQIDATGSLLLLAIEDQAHTYRYDVVADTAITLTAQMSLRLRTPPGGVGVAATLGGPFENLAGFVADGIANVNGTGVERAINAAAGLTAPLALPAPRSPLMCGLFGFEAMLLMAAPVLIVRSRRRRTQ